MPPYEFQISRLPPKSARRSFIVMSSLALCTSYQMPQLNTFVQGRGQHPVKSTFPLIQLENASLIPRKSLGRCFSQRPDQLFEKKTQNKGIMATYVEDAEKSDFITQSLMLSDAFQPSILAIAAICISVAAVYTLSGAHYTITSFPQFNIQEFLGQSVADIKRLGPFGPIYFALLYIIAEVFAVPATPLTVSSGYLFGWFEGTLIVWISAVISCGISFLLGRTFLREKILEVAGENEQFKTIERAVQKEGFKLVLLLRLSPLLPFALSNYLYGLTSVNFWPYILGSAIGFLPGTLAYVYFGQMGKSLSEGSLSDVPTIVYGGILSVVIFSMKMATDIAKKAIEDVKEDPKN